MLTPAYPPFWGGGERYVQALAEALTAGGHQITVVSSTAGREQDFWSHNPQLSQTVEQTRDGKVTVLRCPLRPPVGGQPALMGWRRMMNLLALLPATEPLLWRLRRRFPPLGELPQVLAGLPERFDVVHGFNISWEYPLSEGWRWAQARQIPFVATPFAHLDGRSAVNATMPHQLRVLRSAGGVLTLTDVERAGLLKYGVAEARLQTIWSGVDARPEKMPSEAAVRERFGLQRPFVLFIGRMTGDKGALHAAEAVLALNQEGQMVDLVLVGRTSAEFERFYRGLSAEEREVIRPLGMLAEEEKHRLLAASEMLLLPSKADSLGIVLLEAWSHQKAVIGARAGGIPGVISEGEDGLLVPFGDVAELAAAVGRLLTNRALSQTMGAAGYQKVREKFSWSAVAERVERVYRQVVG